MKLFKTLQTRRPTFSADGSIDFYAPKSWRELTQDQLRYVLTLMSLFGSPVVVKTYMLVRFCGIHIEGLAERVARKQPRQFRCWCRPKWWKPRRWFTLEAWQVESFIGQFDFIDQFDGMDVRLERIHGCRAVDDILDNYPFGDYLMAEQYYQLAVSSGKEEMISKLACYLYLRPNGKHPKTLHLSPAEQMGTLRWFAHVKSVFAGLWPHFFRKVDAAVEEMDTDMRGAMDAQLRALTEGDITKEETIKRLPCWRALTELNQKAREAREFHEKYDKK